MVAALVALLVAAACAYGAASWTVETSPTSVALLGVACFNFDECNAAGGPSVWAYTSTGTSWASTGSPTSQQLNALSCADGTHCWAAGNAGAIVFDNGSSLVSQTSATTTNLLGVACPTDTACFAVGAKSGANGVIVASTNGTSWATQTSTGGQQLNAVACSSATSCWAVGNSGLVIHTSNGTSWSGETSNTTVNLLGVACPSSTVCFAVGAKSGTNAVIDATTNGGTTWATQTSTGGQQLNAIACPDTTHCYAVGNGGLALATTNGTTWSALTSGTTNALDAVSFTNDGFGWATGAGGTIDAYGCRAGGLTDSPPSTLTFPGATLNGLNQTLSTTAPISVDDETATGAGWNLSATSTTFSASGGKTLPTTASVLTGVSQAAGTGNCTAATNVVTYPITIPAAASAPTAVKVFDAAAKTGGGPLNLTLALSLAVPSKATVGSYSSTWTFTLSSGP